MRNRDPDTVAHLELLNGRVHKRQLQCVGVDGDGHVLPRL